MRYSISIINLKNNVKLILIIVFFLLFSCSYSLEKKNSKIPDNLNNLVKCYPDFLSGIKGNNLIWKDGTKMAIDDSIKKKNLDSLLNSPDLADQFFYKYDEGKLNHPPNIDHDPGRIRYEPFFKKMYGATKEEVENNLVKIKWLPKTINKTIRITSINGVNNKLQQISNELDTLPPELKKYVINIAGTYNWRTIKGTNRLSAHSFGIAIDINVKYSNYWKWDSKNDKVISYNNHIPYRIVQIFEKYGFIWGGKWYHYDTMHFEYRPELLCIN